ncbi:hypothetical protein BLNAU_18817 [Blattamonas nauphoetae]|uniref:AMP-activated protein kinase glycogen-binding domain-containing protein n=1 Tax=Blattamonas nauphoetae TaxID=2049346 RepID=A0ABQ9X3F7_9EUKA|nr:hypothetical protein BLNAU_18817 [Blattamonas nauphoetae]
MESDSHSSLLVQNPPKSIAEVFISPDLVAKPVIFSWTTCSPSSELSVVGDWDDWKTEYPLVHVKEEAESRNVYNYYTILNLPNGQYSFQFIVDGQKMVRSDLAKERDSTNTEYNTIVPTWINPSLMYPSSDLETQKRIYSLRKVILISWAVFLVACIACDCLNLHKYTTWSSVTVLLYFIFALQYKPGACSPQKKQKHQDSSYTVTVTDKSVYIFAELALVLSFVAAYVYWVIIHPNYPVDVPSPAYVVFVIVPHGISFLLIFSDVFFLTRIQLQPRRFYIHSLAGTAYVVFCWIQHFAINMWTYAFVNPAEPNAKQFYIGSFFVTPLAALGLSYSCRALRKLQAKD